MATSSRGSKYWEERALQLELAQHNRGSEYIRTLEEAYLLADKETRKKIAALYASLADNNEITMKGARKLLEKNELDEFHWDVEKYIEIGREHSLDPKWMKQLENASLKVRISRLDAMRVHMRSKVEQLMAEEYDGLSYVMREMYEQGYYRTSHMIQTGLAIGSGFGEIDDAAVDKVLVKPWLPDGRNFSERIWGVHRPQLVNDLQTGLTQCIIRGESYRNLERLISKKYDVALHRAETLVRTEGAYFNSVSQQESYKDNGVEYQQFSAVLDLRTSEICRSMDGKVFKTSEIQIGVNAPPLHPRCRSTMIPYFEGNVKARAARGADGNSVEIPEDLSYEEWYERFVKNKS